MSIFKKLTTMKKQPFFALCMNVVLTLFWCVLISSCTKNEDEYADDGSQNTTDVAVTGNPSMIGIDYAQITGYVNLHLITSSYTSIQIGIEISESEEFSEYRRYNSTQLEGNKLSVEIDDLNAATKYFYRTYVVLNDLSFYGEKRSLTTTDFSNVTSIEHVSEITLTSATFICTGDTSRLNSHGGYSLGVAYSTSKEDLNPDSRSRNYKVEWLFWGQKDNFKIHIYPELPPGVTYYYCPVTFCGGKSLLSGENPVLID